MRDYATATARIAERNTSRLPQTELIKRMNDIRQMFRDLDVKDAELVMFMLRQQMKLTRLGIK
jgi:hypothetical protein